MMIAKELGATLTELRKAAGKTQKQVSDALGYSTAQFISNVERGVCYPPKDKLRKYADALGIKFERIKALYIEARSKEIT